MTTRTALKTSLMLTLLFLFSTSVTAKEQPSNKSSAKDHKCPVALTTESNNTQTARLAIEQVLHDWEVAVIEEDLVTLGTLVTFDAEFWTHETEPLIGRNALVAAFEPFLAEYKMDQQYDCKELVIAGDWAFIRGLEVNTLTNKTSGESRISKQRAFSVLQKDGQGQWRFARGMTHRPPKD